MRTLLVLLLLVVAACQPVGVSTSTTPMMGLKSESPPGHSVRVAPATVRIVDVPGSAVDLFELTGTWINPAASVVLDSIEVLGYGLPAPNGTQPAMRRVFRTAPFPTQAEFAGQPIDPAKSYAFSATVCVITWRGGISTGFSLPLGDGSGSVPPPANCAPYVPVLIALAAPPMITGVSASTRIIRP